MSNIQVVQQSIDAIGLIDQSDLRVVQQSIDVIGLIDPPDLRVYQQNIQVAGTKSGQAVVSRAYLEVLSAYLIYNVEQDLVLSQTVQLESFQKDCASTLTVTHDAISSIKELEIVSSLAVTQEATYRLIPLSHGTSELSLTQSLSYIGPHWIDAEDILVLDQYAHKCEIYELTASSTLAITQSPTYGGRLHYWTDSTLVLTDIADTTVKLRSASSALTVTQAVGVDLIRRAWNTLELTQEVTQGVISQYITETLGLTQEATGHQSIITIGPGVYDHVSLDGSTLVLSDTIGLYPIYARAQSDLEVSQTLDLRYPHHVSATSELITEAIELVGDEWVTVYYGLAQVLDRNGITLNKDNHHYIQWWTELDLVHIKAAATSVSANSVLTLVQTGRLSKQEALTQTLTLTQSVSGVLTNVATSDLEVTDSATHTRIVTRDADSTLEVESSFTYTNDSANLCIYDPLIGSGSIADPPRDLLNEPTFTRQDHITLFYPWSNPSTTIELRNPELGNSNSLEFQRINRKTRGGTLIVWADPQWPKNEVIKIEINSLSEAKGQELLTFILASLGKEIGFTDWEGITRYGVILNPDTMLQRNRVCDLSVSLEIELTWSDVVGESSHTLTLTSAASVQKIVSGITSSTLSFYQGAADVPGIKVRSATDALGLTHSVRQVYDRDANSTLVLTDYAGAAFSLESPLAFTQEAWASLPQVSAESVLSMTSTASPGLYKLAASSVLAPWYQRSYTKGYWYKPTSDSTLSITEVAWSNMPQVSSESTLVVIDEASEVLN